MKLTDRVKKRLTLAGFGVACIVLVIAIASQFKPEVPKDVSVQPSSTVLGAVNPSMEPPTPSETPTPAPEVSVKPIDPTVTPAQSKDTGDSTGTEQSIQAEVTKPSEPSQEAKTDPSKTPDGQKVTKPGDSASSSTPKPGDKKDGKIYVPGFGWIKDNGGGGSGTTAKDMYENGNKIGSMD